MSVSLEDLKAYVNSANSDDDVALTRALGAGEALVTQYIGSAAVPEPVLDQAVLQAASEVFQRRNAPMGVSQFSTLDGAPVRVAKDPMTSVYPLLQPYLGWGIA